MFSYKEKKVKVFDSIQKAEKKLHNQDKVLLEGKYSGYFLFKKEGDYYLIKNKCPHQNKPLFEGHCENKSWVCPWHQYAFSLENGRGNGLYLEIIPLTKNEKGLFYTKTVFSIF